jgi:TolB-like protein
MFLVLSLVAGTPNQPLFAQDKGQVSEKLTEAIKFYSELEFDKGITLVDSLLKSPGLTSKDSIAGLATLSLLTYGKGEEYLRRSFDYLGQIAAIGPCLMHLPQDIWPRQLRDQWYRLMKDKNALVCDTDTKLRTIAIMEFDNFSSEKFRAELGYVTKGLAEFFESDFSRISDLKVVERDKLDFILKELELAKAGMQSADAAVQVGKMLGAQIMVFGSVTQLDDKSAKMIVKAVNVETSEIMAFVEKEGKPDFFKMQKEMVAELAQKLDLIVNDEAKSLIEESGTEMYDAASLYSQGLYYMDQYDYGKAYELFKKAYEKDNTFEEARQKMEIYRPLVAS